jgi:hypothetical protein
MSAHVRFTPRKRTFWASSVMSAFVPEANMESWEDHRSTGIVLKRTSVLGLFWSA